MKKIRCLFFAVIVLCLFLAPCKNIFTIPKFTFAETFPHYNIAEGFCLRGKFYTSYHSSSEERKSNIKLASESLDNFFLDVNQEFSFNGVVGVRSEERGYKKSKIIVNGKFVDGLGGGVCQVSTTLYNAVLLAGLEVTEYHPHTLPVNYIAPSFDAMVNYSSADLRFVNNTNSPLFISSKANESQLVIEIYGEKNDTKLVRQSIVTKRIEIPDPEIIYGTIKEYPDLVVGEKKWLCCGKEGLESEGFLISIVNGEVVKVNKIRKDVYKATGATIVEIIE